MERIDRLKAENERLKNENNSLLEQSARWAYNAPIPGGLMRPFLTGH